MSITNSAITLEGAIARGAAVIGTWWPNPWWPSGRSANQDCAAFVSWMLFGLTARQQPFYDYVPNLMALAIKQGRWAGAPALLRRAARAGTTDIRRGDVVICDWKFIGSRDHVGIALGPIENGFVPVLQTNNGGGGQGGGSDSARVVRYAERYILGRWRPAYAETTNPAGAPGTPLAPQTAGGPVKEANRMDPFIIGVKGNAGMILVHPYRDITLLGSDSDPARGGKQLEIAGAMGIRNYGLQEDPDVFNMVVRDFARVTSLLAQARADGSLFVKGWPAAPGAAHAVAWNAKLADR